MWLAGTRKRKSADDDARRVYAIGDVHGRLDLLSRMMELIRADVASGPPRPSRIVLLGDFVDRGPESAELIGALMRLRREPNFIVLKGNHEAAMVDALNGDYAALDLWLAHGGTATLASFGLDTASLDPEDGVQTLRAAREVVPAHVRQWLAGLPTFVRYGRYYFVHAGVRPGVPLDRQTDESRLWIGDEFTSSTADHGAVVVHGHRIYEDGVHIAPNRIGVDTGAYRTGRLSAVRLEGSRCRVITAAAAARSGGGVRRPATSPQ